MDENIGAPLTEEEEQERLAEQARIRREKLAKLASEGRNPYEKVKYDVTADSAYIKNNFSSLEGKEVSIAGAFRMCVSEFRKAYRKWSLR